MPTKITYTVTEAAELLGISRSSAYECVRRGEIRRSHSAGGSLSRVGRSRHCLTGSVFRRLKTGGTPSGLHVRLRSARGGSQGR